MAAKRIIFAPLLCIILLLQACGSTAVKDSNRDSTGKYDGRWSLNVKKMPGLQYVQNWNVSCEAKAYSMDMAVRDGQVYLKVRSDSDELQTTNIDSSGNFMFVIPLRNRATASVNSTSAIVAGDRRLIIKGDLGKSTPTGNLTLGIKQFGWQGCRTALGFEKIPNTDDKILTL